MKDPSLPAIRALAERPLTAEELQAGLAAPVSPEEWEEKRALIRWFLRRYPTPAERLAYVSRAARRMWRPGRDLAAP